MGLPKKRIIGWLGVLTSLVFSSLWAYWGAVENFHEGWYSSSLWENLFMLVFQYLLIPIVFTVLAVVALRWRTIGLVMHGAMAAFSLWFFSGASFSVVGSMIVIPIIALGLAYYFGQVQPKKWAYRLLIALPILIVVVVSLPQGIKVAKRVDDGDFGMRIVEGNGVVLAWAPRGPGWPDGGTSWQEARFLCSHLSEDGKTVMPEEQGVWRLPTVDEAVRSMMLHGTNAGGVWDGPEGKATYERTPDKESPLWDVHSPVIYYWTEDTTLQDDQRAHIVVYHGGVFERRKTDGQRYLSFRAVKEVDGIASPSL